MDETDVRQFMDESLGKKDWDLKREKVKQIFGGQLPEFWHSEDFKNFFYGKRQSWNAIDQGEPGEEI